MNTKNLDINKLCRLAKVPNPKIITKNLKDIFNHVTKIMSGSNVDSNTFKGRSLVIDLKIGRLCSHGRNLDFIPLSMQQLVNES